MHSRTPESTSIPKATEPILMNFIVTRHCELSYLSKANLVFNRFSISSLIYNSLAAVWSALFEPEPFDREAYEQDPESWLNEIRPGRVFQPAQPGEDVVLIAGRSPVFQQVLQGERVNLEVEIEPGAPVTFYTPQVGEFPNRLTTHSVAADDQGIARTTYLAGPGTLGVIDIMAASPVHSGQVRFKVRVSLPD